MKNETNRVGGIDLVKSTAIFFVISFHFFFNNGFYVEPMEGTEMFIATFLNWLFHTCVPLFILTTGYLMRKKGLSKKYYKSLLKVIIAYLIISVITLIARKYFFQDEITWKAGIIGLFSFSTNNYSWYVNMYIGLFLLIPFLNVLYNNLQTKKQKQILIISLILLTSLSRTFLLRSFIPDWWNNVYPLTYYFIGAYLNEYTIKIRKPFLALLAFSVLLAESVLSYYLVNTGKVSFAEYDYSLGYGTFPTLIVTTCLFLMLYNIEIKNKVSNQILTTISKITLEIYLISYLVDRLVYPYLKEYYFSDSAAMLPYYVLIVPFIFIVSVFLAIIINFIQRKSIPF